MIKQASTVTKIPEKDGDTDAVVVTLDTGDSSVVANDRYKHIIDHNLGRLPVGCQITWSDTEGLSVYVVTQNENNITVKFNQARALVNLRIW